MIREGKCAATTCLRPSSPGFRSAASRLDDPAHRLTAIADGQGNRYDASGNLLQKAISSGGQTRTWNYTYNQWGQVTSVDGPRTDVADITYYAYAPQGNLASITTLLH